MLMPDQEALPVGAMPGSGPRLVAVASGKGGVGKTWLSVSLSQCLALSHSGLRVLLLDGDFGLANIDVQLGVVPRLDLLDVLSRRATIEQSIVTVPVASVEGRGSFDILPGHSGVPSLTTLDGRRITDLVAQLRALGRYDVVLMDLCAGIDAVTRRLTANADMALVLTTEEPTALTDAYAVVKLLGRDRVALGYGAVDVRVLINQATSHRSGRQIYQKLATACGSFLGSTPDLAGIVRRDNRVGDAIRHQSMMLTRHPDAPSMVDVRRIAATLFERAA